eukprot:2350603-Amphidinium_carterae.1
MCSAYVPHLNNVVVGFRSRHAQRTQQPQGFKWRRRCKRRHDITNSYRAVTSSLLNDQSASEIWRFRVRTLVTVHPAYT